MAELEEYDLKVPNKLEKNAVSILDMISGGADEKDICDHFKIRRGTFIQWMITFPQFETAVIEARKQRADSYRSIINDRLYEEEVIIDEDFNEIKTGKKIIRKVWKDDVPGEKLIFEKLKWLAEVDNPEKYGTRVKHEGAAISPVQILVDTGIKKIEDTKKKEAILTESEEVTESYSDMDF